MAFFKNFFGKSKRKKDYPAFLTLNVDPETTWEIIGKLGDGAFGEVFKVRCYICQFLCRIQQPDVMNAER